MPAAKIDLTFADILKDLNGAVMGSGEMRLGRWGFLTDVMYSKVTSSGKLPGPYFSELEVRSESLILQGNVMYRVFTNDTVDFDLGAGARYWDLDTKLTIKPGILNTRIDRSETENWIDPVVGMRATTRFNDVWSLTLAGDIGGFDVGSRLTYQVLGSINYKWSENVMLRAGYRLLSVDYKNNDFLYDVRMHGPIFAFTYKF